LRKLWEDGGEFGNDEDQLAEGRSSVGYAFTSNYASSLLGWFISAHNIFGLHKKTIAYPNNLM